MTATEVNARTEQQLRLMGPVLGRQHFEFLRPVIERVFGIMYRKNLIPQAPKQIQGKKFDVRYSSLVARAQRMAEGQNLVRAFSMLVPVGQVKPETWDTINGDSFVKKIWDVYGLDQELLNTAMDVKKTREARAQAQAQAAQDQQKAMMAENMGKMLPGMAQMQQAQQQNEGMA